MEDSQLTSLTNYWAGEVKAEPMYEHSLRGNNNKNGLHKTLQWLLCIKPFHLG